MRRCGRVLVVLLALSLRATWADTDVAGLTTGSDPETGLRFWRWDARGVRFELTQRLPDQTRGFFEARGFDPTLADEIANACVFQSSFKNTVAPGGAAVRFDLDTWRIKTREGVRRILVREYWDSEWSKRRVSRKARIAFEWALLPTRQRYEPGDYNWGMAVFGMPPGAMFDLEFHWQRNDRRFVHTIEQIECAPDIHPDTQ